MPVNVRLPADTIAALDVLRRERPDLPTRPQLIRSIVEEYLRERRR
jgi:metal-responsive CopG/Arc/MetJ family transcriptional regulator